MQIHNWANDFEDASPNMEFVAPTSAYVVVDGVKTHLDLTAMPVRSTGCQCVPVSLFPAGSVVVESDLKLANCFQLFSALYTPLQPMTPRQMRLVAGPADVCNQGGQTMLREEEAPYAFDSKDARRSQKARLQRYLSLMKEEGLDGTGATSVPSWQSKIVKGTPERCATADNSTIIDSSFAESECQLPGRGLCAAYYVRCVVCACAAQIFALSTPVADPLPTPMLRPSADAELRKIWVQLEEKYKMPSN